MGGEGLGQGSQDWARAGANGGRWIDGGHLRGFKTGGRPFWRQTHGRARTHGWARTDVFNQLLIVYFGAPN
jgi:hypothetical protein